MQLNAVQTPSNPWLGNVLRECAVYKIAIRSSIVDSFLPNRVLAYADNTPLNLARRYYFFSEQAAPLTRSLFDEYIDRLPLSTSFDSFLQILSREFDSTVRYNYVIKDDHVLFIRVPRHLNEVVRPLCKHVTISSRAPFVRYAGEIWSDGRGSFIVNNNSGTYRPSDWSVDRVVQMFKYLSAKNHFQGVNFRFGTLPPVEQVSARKHPFSMMIDIPYADIRK